MFMALENMNQHIAYIYIYRYIGLVTKLVQGCIAIYDSGI